MEFPTVRAIGYAATDAARTVAPQKLRCALKTHSKNAVVAALVAVLLLAAAGGVALGQEEVPRTFDVAGVVKELPADGKSVVIQHEAISNYMAAMTMPFDVHDTNLLRNLQPGDRISFRLNVASKEGWIDNIILRQRSLLGASSPGIELSRATAPLDIGQLLPDYHFTNELGQGVHLAQYRGRVLAFTFFFTSCPYPNFCPRLTSNFGEAAAQLKKAALKDDHWQLLSISFDPKTDTPQRLQDYAGAAHEYDPAHWSFLTGDPEQISELADNFGEIYSSAGATISHNVRTVVVDPQGRITKVFEGNTWTPEQLVDEIVKASNATP